MKNGSMKKSLVKRKKKKKKIEVFVFGSNLAGRHGKGAAKTAVEKYGAIYGKGRGRQGHSYAIPTKDKKLRSLGLDRINYYICQFIYYAFQHPNIRFRVTKIGCGLARYKPKEIAPFFRHAPKNVILPKEFDDIIMNAISVPPHRRHSL